MCGCLISHYSSNLIKESHSTRVPAPAERGKSVKMKILIVGAGVGGTAVAARLAKEGHTVTVYEKNSFHGGRCSLIHHEGHRFDQGPSLLLMLEIFEETFADLGTNIYEHLELLCCSPNYKIHFHDGQSMELSSQLPELLREIKRFESGNSEAKTMDFLRETEIHYRKSVTNVLKENFTSFWDLLRPRFIPLPFQLHLLHSVYGRISKYFQSDYLRRAFTFQTMYLGMSPYDAPAPYNLLQYTEMAGGIWYPKGGFTEVVRSLEKIAKSHGATFQYNAEVTQLKVNERKEVIGAVVDGKIEEADLVVCNADLVYVYNKLLPPTKYGKGLGENTRLTSSSISFYWSMRTVINGLTTHNIFLAKDYKGSFDEIFRDHSLPTEPSFYVNVPSRIDPSAAPEGKDTIAVLVPVGHLIQDQTQDIDALVTRAREFVVGRLEKELKINDFSSLIAHEIINDPRDWEQKFNLWKGSILGLSHNITQVLSFRPRTRSEQFKNLYFVGASAQPGTGVPLVLCSAKLVATQIHNDLEKVKIGTEKKALNGMLITSLILTIILIFIVFFLSFC